MRQVLTILAVSAVVLLATVFASCSEMSGTVSVPPGTTEVKRQIVTIRSARTGQPVAGAAVTADSVKGQLVSTSDGVVHMVNVIGGTRVTVELQGYLHSLVTNYQPESTLYLLPDDADQPYSVERASLFGNDDNARLIRIPDRIRTVTVFPDQTFRNDSVAMADLAWAVDAHNRANAQINAVSRPGILPPPTFVIAPDDQTPAEFRIDLVFDPHDPTFALPGWENAGAITYGNVSGDNYLLGAKIVFRYMEDVFWGEHMRRALAHEIGHARGVGHLPDGVYGIMGQGDHFDGFAPVEVGLMVVLLVRPAGTMPVDNTTSASTASSVSSRWVVLCKVTTR